MAANGDSESTPLMQRTTSSPKPYYFLAGTSSGRRDSIDESYESRPVGASEAEFASRSVMNPSRRPRRQVGFFARLFGRKMSRHTRAYTVMKGYKAAIKVEPKVFFASERTFLAWLHTSVLLAGASIALTSFSDDNILSQLYGVILLPVAISFLIYAMHQYGKRSKLVRAAAPGPYEDVVGPTVLSIVLICSIVAQFSIKLYSMM